LLKPGNHLIVKMVGYGSLRALRGRKTFSVAGQRAQKPIIGQKRLDGARQFTR
jgi:hypothetical protein